MEKDIKEAEDSIKGAHAQITKLHKDMAALNTKLAKHEVQFSPIPAS
jgi:structural maintenance of chromosome 2